MRTISGRRNRTALLGGGLLMMLAAAWVASASTPLLELWPGGDPVLPHADSVLADITSAHSAWLLPAALVASVLAVVVGVLLLIAQVPAAPTRSTLRVTDEHDQLLGSVAPMVLERALHETLEGISGVGDASVQVTGSADAPRVRATVSVADDAEIAWVAAHVRGRLIEDLTTVLGVAPLQVDLLIRLRSAPAGRAARLGSDRSGAPLTHPATL